MHPETSRPERGVFDSSKSPCVGGVSTAETQAVAASGDTVGQSLHPLPVPPQRGGALFVNSPPGFFPPPSPHTVFPRISALQPRVPLRVEDRFWGYLPAL